MQAFQLVSAQTTEVRDVPVPEPKPGEVLVKIGAAGACHSDLHLMHAPAEAVAAFPLPFTLGHENAGWVEALGPGVAVDVDERQLSMAQEVGAHEIVRSDAEAAAAIRELVGPPPGGADVVLDNVSVDPTLQLGASVVATGGWLMLVGLGGGTLPLTVGLAPTIPLEARLTIPFWGTRAELVEVISLARAGLISAHVERFDLADAATAYERLEGGEMAGRAVVVPSR